MKEMHSLTKKISSYDKPFNVNQDSQSIEDEQMHLLNGSIHEDINQVLCHSHMKRPHLIAITIFARLQVCNLSGGTGKKAKQFEGTSANSIKVSLSDLDAVRIAEIFRILL